jgi:hypothetical protein
MIWRNSYLNQLMRTKKGSSGPCVAHETLYSKPSSQTEISRRNSKWNFLLQRLQSYKSFVVIFTWYMIRTSSFLVQWSLAYGLVLVSWSEGRKIDTTPGSVRIPKPIACNCKYVTDASSYHCSSSSSTISVYVKFVLSVLCFRVLHRCHICSCWLVNSLFPAFISYRHETDN